MNSNTDVKLYLSGEAEGLLNTIFKNVLPGLLNDSDTESSVIYTLELMKKMCD